VVIREGRRASGHAEDDPHSAQAFGLAVVIVLFDQLAEVGPAVGALEATAEHGRKALDGITATDVRQDRGLLQ